MRSVLADSYKAGHFAQYPETERMTAYGEFRRGFEGDAEDTRLLFYGMRYIVDTFVARRWTREDVERADAFFSQHAAPTNGPYPFPKELFLRFVEENGGFFPVTLQALPEGSCVHAHVPVYQITAEAPYAKLVTFLETLLTMVWYPTTVATLSRRARDVIGRAFEESAEGGAGSPLLGSRLHDFGFRGCTCVEQSVIGGCAHLLSFEGSDTMSAAFYAQFELNGGRPVASSIPASEHSVMTSWASERDAVANMVSKYGSGIFACVMDSYDYAAALSELLPSVAQEQVAQGGYMVLRPDSGDPVECVLMALRAGEKVFGCKTNAKGFKVIQGCGVIQGDGVGLPMIGTILRAAMDAGFSAENVAFGMGGGLLQKVNRDTMSFATKLCHMKYADGTERDVMKAPKTDSGKVSLPGVLSVRRVGGVPQVFPGCSPGGEGEEMLQVVYDKGPVAGWAWDDFDAVKARAATEWANLPYRSDPLSPEIKARMRAMFPNLDL